MHDPSLAPLADRLDTDEDAAARLAAPDVLARALQASRKDTLARFAACEHALIDLQVPQRETLNPPLWELGHIGWFQEFWIARNPQRHQGARADPAAPRGRAVRDAADALYDSSAVPHVNRWSLPLPDSDATRADLARQLATTLQSLRDTENDVQALYFFRLALLHEDMHHEAALIMAQALGIAVDDARWQPARLADARVSLTFEAAPWRLGNESPGFVFDNELAAHTVSLPATEIDSRVLRWADYLPFVESGGYAQARWWGAAGLAWLAEQRVDAPRYLQRGARAWEQWRAGRWSPLDPMLPACHLTAFEAEAWCRWAGRRLPTEAEWERAAVERPNDFRWGQVWEWTASTFGPYLGFMPHPYRDYSQPWFGDRPVLRGASFMTQPRLRHPRYRNFFKAHRNDVAAGFRTCRI